MRQFLLILASTLCVTVAFAGEPAESWDSSAGQLRPFWLSTTMDGESALFIKDAEDGRPRASLLLAPTRVLSVRSSSGAMT